MGTPMYGVAIGRNASHTSEHGSYIRALIFEGVMVRLYAPIFSCDFIGSI